MQPRRLLHVPALGSRLRGPAKGVVLLLGLAACQPGELTLVEPDDSGGPALGTLVAHVELRAADSALADTLGWTDGVPGAQVRILRNGTAEWLTAETDSSGMAVFQDLEPGRYLSYVERILGEADAAPRSTSARGFGDGHWVSINVDTTRTSYELRASQRTGLVISEVSGAAPPPWEVPKASAGTAGNRFFEVYNQSNETLFLDGLVFGAFPVSFCHGCFGTCESGVTVRFDSTAVYSREMLAFPGSGGEYPIAPGETKLIAVSAQDHRELHEDMLDLRGADFEIGAGSFADNPSVPDMRDIGLDEFNPGSLLSGSTLRFLARPFEPSSLSSPWRNSRGERYYRVPLDLVLDIAYSEPIWPDADEARPACAPFLHPHVDRFPGGFLNIGLEADTERTLSFQREVLTTEDGIPILMDTNTSAADFEMMRYTPGELPNRGQ